MPFVNDIFTILLRIELHSLVYPWSHILHISWQRYRCCWGILLEVKFLKKDTKSLHTGEDILPDIADIHLPPLCIKADNLTIITNISTSAKLSHWIPIILDAVVESLSWTYL